MKLANMLVNESRAHGLYKRLMTKGVLFTRRGIYSIIEKVGKPIKVRLSHNLKIQLYPKGQIPKLLFTARFEAEDIASVANIIKPGMNILDIGANVGLYSIIAGKLAGKTGKVWAFEPSSESSERLKDNLLLNQVTSVEVVQVALADIEDSLALKRDAGYKDGDRYLAMRKNMNKQVASVSADCGDMEIVPVTTLDRFFSINGKAFQKIDFIKMDVEGGEFAVFRGARQLLLSNPEVVMFFECTPQGCYCAGHTMEDVIHYLSDLGFCLFCRGYSSNTWVSNIDELKQAGNIWACRDAKQLPPF